MFKLMNKKIIAILCYFFFFWGGGLTGPMLTYISPLKVHADPSEMLCSTTFHMGPHCFRSLQYTKDLK